MVYSGLCVCEGDECGRVSRPLGVTHKETIDDFYFSSLVHNPGGQEYRTVLLKQKKDLREAR